MKNQVELLEALIRLVSNDNPSLSTKDNKNIRKTISMLIENIKESVSNGTYMH